MEKQNRTGKLAIAAVSIVGIAIIILLVLATKPTELPGNTGKLDDGSTIKLVHLSTGPDHEFYDAENASTWDRFRYGLPRNIRDKFFDDLTIHKLDPKAAPDALGVWLQLNPLDGRGAFRIRVRDESRNYGTSDLAYPSFRQDKNHKLFALRVPAFPRTSKQITLELSQLTLSNATWSHVISWNVSNPLYASRPKPMTLVTNQLFTGYEIKVTSANVQAVTNYRGSGTSVIVVFEVSKEGEPSGDWVVHEATTISDGFGNQPKLSVQANNAINEVLVGGGWGEFRLPMDPLHMRVLLAPNPEGNSKLVETLQVRRTVTNALPRGKSMTNYPESFTAFDQSFSLRGYPAKSKTDGSLRLYIDDNEGLVDVTLESLVDQQGRDIAGKVREIRDPYDYLHVMLREQTNSTSFIAIFKIQKFVELNFVVEPKINLD